MRAVLFEGTPEEFARVEAVFRAGGDPALLTRSIVLPRARPKAWPELGEGHSYRLARRVLEIMPERVRDALGYLAEVQASHGEQTIDGWAEYAGRQPQELCGYLAELGRCASRAFIELFGCDPAPERMKGAAHTLLQKIPGPGGAYVVLRPGLMRAMADLGMVAPSLPEEAQEHDAREPEGPQAAPRSARRPADRPKAADPRPKPPASGRPSVSGHPPPDGSWGDLGRLMSGFLGPETGERKGSS